MKIFENMCNVVDQLQDVCICLVLLVQKFNLEITDGDFGVQGAFPHKLRITDLKLHLRHDASTFDSKKFRSYEYTILSVCFKKCRPSVAYYTFDYKRLVSPSYPKYTNQTSKKRYSHQKFSAKSSHQHQRLSPTLISLPC